MKKKKTTTQKQLLSPENYIRQKSKNLPMGKCFVTEDWQETKMGQVVVTREHVNGNVTVCMYLVDLNCLGVKDTMYKFNIPFEEVERMLKIYENEGVKFIGISYELAHNIIYAGIEFAEEFGFKPNKDFTSITCHFLEEDTDDIPVMEIECGDEEDGNPVYVNSGFESPVRVREILAQLNKTVGRGNYHYVLNVDNDDEIYDDDDEIYDDDDDDEIYDDEDEFYDDESDFYDDEKKEMISELEKLDKEQRQKLFAELLVKDDDENPLSGNEVKQLVALTHILAYDIVDVEELKKEFDSLAKKFDHKIVEEDTFPNSLFADLPGEGEEIIFGLFNDSIDAIFLNKNPIEAIEKIRKDVGDIPVVDFLELLYLKHDNNKKYNKKLKEYAEKRPNYFLIQLYQHADSIKSQNISIEKLEKLLSDECLPVTEFEANSYFPIYAFGLVMDKDAKLSTILAFEEYIETLYFLSRETRFEIFTLAKICKMKKIINYLEQTGELKTIREKT